MYIHMYLHQTCRYTSHITTYIQCFSLNEICKYLKAIIKTLYHFIGKNGGTETKYRNEKFPVLIIIVDFQFSEDQNFDLLGWQYVKMSKISTKCRTVELYWASW
jgi:hypothetical protein